MIELYNGWHGRRGVGDTTNVRTTINYKTGRPVRIMDTRVPKASAAMLQLGDTSVVGIRVVSFPCPDEFNDKTHDANPQEEHTSAFGIPRVSCRRRGRSNQPDTNGTSKDDDGRRDQTHGYFSRFVHPTG